MIEIAHRVKVFVYRFAGRDVRYLLVRARPRAEALWGPIVGPIRPSEDVVRAVRRRVREEIGVDRMQTLLDLRAVERTHVGGLDLIEWAYACQIPGADEPPLLLGPDLSEWCWEDFQRAYQRLEFEANRQAMLRLHTLLNAGGG
jgi:ADP-ribose pyrophosphatase YjhB (NUDIX family)